MKESNVMSTTDIVTWTD